VPSPLTDLAARIERAPEAHGSADLGCTALDRLANWWTSINGKAPVNYRSITLGSTTFGSTTAGSPIAAAHNADALIDAGANLLACTASGNEVTARIIVGLYAGADVHQLLPATLADSDWMMQAESMRNELFALRDMRAEPTAILRTLNAELLEQRVDAILTCSARSTPYLLQSLDDYAAALIADRLAHRAKSWWLVSGTSVDPAASAAIQRLGLPPTLDLGLSAQANVGSDVISALLEIALRD